jgi:sugar phosphate permease
MTEQDRVFAKCARRLIPFMMLLFVLNYLDRVNVGFAALEMNRDLGLSPAVYGFGAGIFFIGYSLFEVPSNLILARTGARVWIARIMVTWGLVTMCMAFVVGPLEVEFKGIEVALRGLSAVLGCLTALYAWPRPGDRRAAHSCGLRWFARRIQIGSVR